MLRKIVAAAAFAVMFAPATQTVAAEFIYNVTINQLVMGQGDLIQFKVEDSNGAVNNFTTSCPVDKFLVLDPDSVVTKEMFALLLTSFALNKPMVLRYIDGNCYVDRQIIDRILVNP